MAALALPIRLIHDLEVHARALEIAGRFSLSAAYDAHYPAVAEMLGGESSGRAISDWPAPWARLCRGCMD
jgi:hypothetical protein